MIAPCPPFEALRRLGDDPVDGDTFLAIEAHVSRCPACRARLDRLALLDDPDPLDEPTPVDDLPSPPVPPPLAPEIPGLVLGDVLGRGGSGVVFEAEQPRIGRRVAVKVFSSSPGLDADARRRWLREARAIGRVRHPHVVRLHEAGEHEGRLYLVLDLIPGGSLRDRAPGPIPPRAAALLVEKVARAVEAIHREGLLHLDVKPSNILLDGPPGADWPELSPVLSDFGIALDGDDPHASGSIGLRGTPAFMAPEQVAGRRDAIGPPADVFALGATLYALIAGRPPFQAASGIETIDLIRSRDPAPPRALVPGIPRDLETICLHALRKDPGRRYPSADAMADDLRRWLDGFPIRARAASTAGRLARWCRRHPVPAALGLVLGLTILASLVGLTALWRRSEAQRQAAHLALARARSSEAAADRAVGDLLELIGSAVHEPHRRLRDRVDEAMPVLLDLTAQLRRTPRLAASHAPAISALEIHLSDLLRARGDHARVSLLLDDAAELLRPASEANPGDAALAASYAEALMVRGLSALGRGRADLATGDGRLAWSILAPVAGDPLAMHSLVWMHNFRCALAEELARLGRREEALGILRENAGAFGRLRGVRPGDPIVALLSDLAAREREPGSAVAAMEATAEALRRMPDGARMPRALTLLLGHRIAQQLSDGLDAGGGVRPEPGQAADSILRRLDAELGVPGPDPDLRFAIVQQLGERGSLQAMGSRRADRPEDARWAIGWMSALGRALERRDPGDAGAHLMLSKASEQRHKLAWHLDDAPSREPALREALSEGTMALALRPEDEWLRRHVASLREKYVRLVSREPEP